MFKEYVQSNLEFIHAVGNEIEEDSDRRSFYTGVAGALLLMSIGTVWVVTMPFRMIRKGH